MLISVINNKGGVGKTTTSANLGHALARKNRRVLVVDMDSQCNATDILVRGQGLLTSATLYDLIAKNSIPNPQACILATRYPNLFLLPNIPETATLEPELISSVPDSLFRLRNNIRQYALENFDFTFLDCPPNLGTFVILALYSSDFVVVPTEAGSKHSSEGLIKAVEFINEIQQKGNPDLRFLRLLITKVDRRTSISKAVVDQIRTTFPKDKVFKTQIPVNTDLQKAEFMGQTIFQYRSNALSAIAYSHLADELVNLTKKAHNTPTELKNDQEALLYS